MSKKFLTTDKLVKSVVRRASLPTNRNTLTNQDIADILNEELDIRLCSYLMTNHEEYLINYIDYPIDLLTTNFIFKIPTRAIGNKLRMVSYVDSNNANINLTRIEPEIVAYYQSSGTQEFCYFIENDNIRLINRSTITNAALLRMSYALSPSQLVLDKFAGVITALDPNTGIIQVDKIPDNFFDGGLFEFTAGYTPNKLIKFDVPLLAINTTTREMTFNPASLLNTDFQISILNIRVGDFVTVSGESIVPQGIPTELHPLLAEMAANHCIRAQGDAQAIANSNESLITMTLGANNLIGNRVDGSPQKINNLNSHLHNSNRRYRGN